MRDDYLGDRYTRGGLTEPIAPSYLRLRDLDDARIAIAGFLGHYPLYGREPDNIVALPARRTAHGGFRRIRSCGEWLRALDAGDYDYVVTAPDERGRVPAETAWTRLDPHATEILAAGRNVVFRLDHARPRRGSAARCATLRSNAR